jgi:AcrR family transcriptional regulator
MAQSDTVERILDAAEALFAERGFAETSLRTITSTAGVNLAAVNYHFGSKKELIQAVFARFLTPFCQELESSLDQLMARDETPLTSSLLKALFQTALLRGGEVPDNLTEVDAGSEEKVQRFMRLLGLAYNQSQGHLRRFIVANYGNHYQRFTQLLQKSAPQLDPISFYWRLYFMLGATVFTLSSFDSIAAILKEDFAQDASVDSAADLLVPALTGMFENTDLEPST